MERWRQPLRITAVEPDPDGVVEIAGRVYQNVNVTVADEDEFRRLCEGYVCASCGEPHETPYPEHCTVCMFPMRSEQQVRLAMAFKGRKWVGPRESIDDEFARMDEENKRKRWRGTDSNILLPPGVDLGP